MTYNIGLIRIKSKISRIVDYIHDRMIYYCLEQKSGTISLRSIILNMLLRGRKIIGFYGECHIYVYGGYLSELKSVKNKYCLLGAKEIQYLARWHKDRIIRKSAWDKLDVLIYNPGTPMREGAPELKQVLAWVPVHCQKIEVTNAAFKGYMPQHTERVFPNNGFFVWGDKYLNKLIDKEVIELDDFKQLESVNYISAEKVNEFFDKSVKRMKMYERECTIRIADYIEKNGKERVLYYSVTHPETEIMQEITRRILEELGISERLNSLSKDTASGMYDLHSHGEAVYPSVLKGLGISEMPDRKIQHGNFKELQLSFKEYIREYVKLGKELTGKTVRKV